MNQKDKKHGSAHSDERKAAAIARWVELYQTGMGRLEADEQVAKEFGISKRTLQGWRAERAE
jgi:hypothetical protein